MPFSSRNLLRELNQHGEFNWALELKNGKEAYAFLMSVVGGPELNVTQTRNGLIALFRIRDHGTGSEVLQKFVETSAHPNKRIRSKAVGLAIGLARFSAQCERVPVLLSASQERILREALLLGVTKKVEKFAEKYLSTRGSSDAGTPLTS
jgi:hypothetical protein